MLFISEYLQKARESFVTQSLQALWCRGSWSTAAATVAVGITTATALQEARRLLTQQESRSPQFHWSCCTAKAAKASSHLWRLLLFYTCSAIAVVSGLDGQIPRVLCCRGCWSTIAEIASVKAEGRKKIS